MMGEEVEKFLTVGSEIALQIVPTDPGSHIGYVGTTPGGDNGCYVNYLTGDV